AAGHREVEAPAGAHQAARRAGRSGLMGPELSLDDLLAAHAAGRLAEPVALIVTTHLALMPESRARYRRYEAIGGTLLEGIEPVPLADAAWSRLCGRLDQAPAEPRR